MEGGASIPGKYLMDFKEEDEKWLERTRDKFMEPYREIYALIDWNEYSQGKMVVRYEKEREDELNKLKERKKELTNAGKRMLAKKEEYKSYSGFRQRFRDVFKELDFTIEEEEIEKNINVQTGDMNVDTDINMDKNKIPNH